MLLLAPSAHAEPAAAEALFREGRALLERGDLALACEKLEASNALEPSAGTLLNLAACRAKQGKTATAWALFVSAERLAHKQGREEQAAEAKRRALELEPRLSTLTLLAPQAPPGLTVRKLGQVVQPASLGSALPVDPGVTTIEVSAPGYQTARLEITVGASADRRVVQLPALRRREQRAELSPSASAHVLSPAAEPDARGPRLPWAIGGVGAGALAAGSVLGLLALSSNSQAINDCNTTDADACRSTQERRDAQALASTVCFGVGLLGVGVATVWLLTGSSTRDHSAWSYGGEVTRESALLQMRVGF